LTMRRKDELELLLKKRSILLRESPECETPKVRLELRLVPSPLPSLLAFGFELTLSVYPFVTS
jgi:hypothetical protein